MFLLGQIRSPPLRTPAMNFLDDVQALAQPDMRVRFSRLLTQNTLPVTCSAGLPGLSAHLSPSEGFPCDLVSDLRKATRLFIRDSADYFRRKQGVHMLHISAFVWSDVCSGTSIRLLW